MCDLCSTCTQTRHNERMKITAAASRLRFLADQLEHMAQGTIKPHGTEAKAVSEAAKASVRYLVEEYV